MQAEACQRWRDRRGVYRPRGEPIRTTDYDVAEITDDTTARTFVERHHYSGSYPAARFRFGLYRAGELAGVAVFSVPFPNAVRDLPAGAVELGRFVLLDEVPANGESWFLSRALRDVRVRSSALVSFSDPERRTDASGRSIFAGHIGTVYQATNATYLGRGPRRTWRLLPDGRVLSARSIQKIRAGERGWRPAAALLQAHGAPAPGADRLGWLHEWLPRLTRTFRHAGVHKYVWSFDRHLRLAALPYPKWAEARAA